MVQIVQEIETTDVAGKLLGQRVAAPKTYSPDILVPVPRTENRDDYGITNETFIGYDTWNCYEISFLLDNGIPLSFVGKLIYPSYSKNIVESKSLKLYLNSFNMEKMGATVDEAKVKFIETVRKDLVKILDVEFDSIRFNLFSPGSEIVKAIGDEAEYFDLMTLVQDIDSAVDIKENPNLLTFDENESNYIKVSMNAMRSNCRVTHQPDWATIYIEMKSEKAADLKSILKYIVSFRDESHFHEECVEMVFKRLKDKFNPEILNVTALYTRRGGIDICPQRSNDECRLHLALMSDAYMQTKTIHQ
jgi:7-cyano-7-deazaguanine reductase